MSSESTDPSRTANRSGARSSFTINLRVAGWRTLVVGGGPIALTKALRLQQAGADVFMVAPRFARELPGIEQVKRAAGTGDLEGVRLAIFASDDRSLNRSLYEEARRRGILAAAVDDPGAADFFMPAILRRDALEVAVSTAGICPAFSAWVRDRLAKIVTESWGHALNWLANMRAAHLMELPYKERARILRALLAEDPVAYFEQGLHDRWADVSSQILGVLGDESPGPERLAATPHVASPLDVLPECPAPCPIVEEIPPAGSVRP